MRRFGKLLPCGLLLSVLLPVSILSAQLPPNNLIETIAGTGIAGYSGDGGPMRYTALNHPEIILFDSTGNMYFSESGNNRVRKVDTSGNITTIAGNGSAGFSGDTGPATLAQLNYPIGLALDSNNNLYIVDQNNQRIRKVALGTGQITTVVGTGTAGYNGDNQQATAAQINNPHSLAVDSSGNLYIADQSNNRVRMVNTSGVITTIAGTGTAAGSGTGASIGDGGAATSAKLNGPTGIAVNSAGTTVWVAENAGHRVRQFTVGGNITTMAGTGSAGFSNDNAAANTAQLNAPLGLSLDSNGNLYISDRGNNRIRVVVGATGSGTISTLVGNGAAGFSGDGGLPTQAEENQATQAVVGPNGNLYIADWSNHRIRETIATPTGNSVATLNSMYPTNVVANNGAFTLTVYGANFVPGATVQWKGSGRVTTFVSPTILTATILVGDVSSPTTAAVTVLNPGVSASSSATFTVLTSAPTTVNTLIQTFAGQGFNNGSDGDGGPALYAGFGTIVQSTFDSAGNFYFADCGNGRVRMVNPAGVISTIAGGGNSNLENIPATAAGLNCPNAVAVDNAGNLYVSEYNGFRIRKIVLSSGNISTYTGATPAAGNIQGFAGDGGPAAQATFSHIPSMVIDPAGNLYVVDRDNERIRKIGANGGTVTTIAGNGINGYFGEGGPAQFMPLNDPYQITRDSSGNLYFSMAGGDRVMKIDSFGTLSTIGGNGNGGAGGDGGIGTNATVNSPEGIAVDSNGNVYFGDANNERIRMISGGVIVTVAGTNYGFSGDGGLALSAQISNQLYGLSFDSAGRLYLSDANNFRVRRLEPPSSANPMPSITSMSPSGAQAGSGNTTVNIYGTGFVAGSVANWNGSARSTTFVSSTQLTFVVQSFDLATAGQNGSVTVFNPTTGGGGGTSAAATFTVFAAPSAPNSLMITYAGNGIVGFSGNGGPAIDATFNNLQQMVFDSAGNMYIAEYRNHVIRKVAANGIVSTFAGNGTAGYSGDTGQATNAQLNGPTGVALDGNGNLYISEYDGNRIRKVNISSGVITLVAGSTLGTAGSSGDNGPAVNALLNNPFGIASDSAGNIYIADRTNHRVRKINTSGTITTVAGTGQANYFGDGGPAINAPLDTPCAVALDAAGNLYIADQANQRIRRVDMTTGYITTFAGNGNPGFGGDGGPAIYANLYNPIGLAFDAQGNMYIADLSNQRIRQVTPFGTIYTVAGNGTNGYSGDGGLATSAEISSAQFVAVNPLNNNLYLSDNGDTHVRELVAPATSTTAPALTGMNPSSIEAGNPGFTITVFGSNFAAGAYVQWNGSQRNTTFISASKLTATINAFDVATPNTTATVTVFNPGGGGASNGQMFNIIQAPAASTNLIITTVGVNGIAAYAGDTGPALFAAIQHPEGLVYDSVGNLYIADCSNNVVRKVTPGGTITTFAGTGTAGYNGDSIPAINAQLSCPVGLAFDSNGFLYIADQDNHRVRQVTPTGSAIFTVAGTGPSGYNGDGITATTAQITRPQGLAIDAQGNLYIADYDVHRVRKVVIGGNITTFAGTGNPAYDGDGGPANVAPLYHPTGLAFDSTGTNLYIADYDNARIRMVNTTSGIINTVAGNGSGTFSGDGGPATSAAINNPIGLFVDAQNNIYFGDASNQRVRKVTSGGLIFTVAGNGNNGFTGDGGMATNAEIYTPTYVTLDPNGNLVFSDYNNSRIRKLVAPATSTSQPTIASLNPSRIQQNSSTFTMVVYGANFSPGATVQFNGNNRTTTFISVNRLLAVINSFDLSVTGAFPITVVNPGSGGSSTGTNLTIFPTPSAPTALMTTFAGTGFAGFSGDGGQALFSSLYNPNGIVKDSSGNFYISDSSNHRVRKITPAGVISTVAGTGTPGYNGDNQPANQAQLNSPTAVALDSFGNLYISENGNQRVRKVTTGGTITTVAGNGTTGSNGDGNLAINAQLNNPWGLAIDSSGNIYIADRSNHRVRVVNASTGNISTFAGNGVNGYFGDGGPATVASLSQPISLVLDLVGNLYISEFGNCRIRKIDSSGTTYTVAGNGSCNYSGDGGIATNADIQNPVGIFLDGSGNLYISDYNNARIREVTGGIISTIGGNGTFAFSGDGGLAVNAEIYYPEGLFVDAGGNVYFADTNNNRIRKIGAPSSNNPGPAITSMQPSSAQQGGATFTIVVNGTGFVAGSTVQWNTFNRPTTFISANQLLATINNFDIATVGNQTVTVSSPTTGNGGGVSAGTNFLVYPTPTASTAMINAFSGQLNGSAGFADSSSPSSVKYNAPQFASFDASGNMYVPDCNNNRVREVTPTGGAFTIAGGGSVLGDNGPATSAQLACPISAVVDGLGNIYISEQNSHRIRKIVGNSLTNNVVTPGTITTIAGNGTAGFAGDGGAAANSQLNEPQGLALDATGNLYIAEYRNYRIRKIAINNGVVGNISTVAGNGISGYFGDGGPALNAPLVGPTGVAFDALGNMYIADYDGMRIRQVDTGGNIHLIAGTGSQSYGGDGGPAIYAALDHPYQLTVDTAGNIYFTDHSNFRVRKIDNSVDVGIVTTVAGNGNQGNTGDGGLAANAQLFGPNGVALDSNGNLFIVDGGNGSSGGNRVREVGAVTGQTCLYSISPSSANFGAAATTGSFIVNTSAGCFWTTTSHAAWLTITSPASSAGPGTVQFSVAANPNAASQQGTITAAGLTYTATQAGTGCSFTLAPALVGGGFGTTVGAAASTGNMVTVTSPAGCPWTAVSNSAFIHITAGASGTGNGTVTYSVDANTLSSNQAGSMTIGGQLFQVTQTGTACSYSIQISSANYSSSAATGSLGVTATAGCPWTAVSSQTWLMVTSGASGTGNGSVGYSVAANTSANPRSATITVSGNTGLVFTVNQQGFVSPAGNVAASGATGAAGATVNVPIVLTLNTGQLDSISFGVQVTPVSSAPAITGSLSFTGAGQLTSPSITDTHITGNISVFFSGFNPAITGTATLGTVQVPIPAGASIGQTYSVSITGANGSSAGTPVALTAGANGTILLSTNYLVGDVFPYTGNSVGSFGVGNGSNYGANGTLDLIYTLRQVVATPGFTIASCTDRFDAMDSFPADTLNTRGGNGVVDNLDLIQTLNYVNGVVTPIPTRATRGLCNAEADSASPVHTAASKPRQEGPVVATLELGSPDENGRIPVYLDNQATLPLIGLSFAVNVGDAQNPPSLKFEGAEGFSPTLVDTGVEGAVAVAYLQGLYTPPGRTLLGYVTGSNGTPVRFGGVVANTRDGGTPRVDTRGSR